MPSTLSWIDFDSEAQQRAQRILTLFKERDTRDELGFGPIRDAIADTLFPGTSVLHTRLRYLLFIPWIYTSLENKGVLAAKIRERARSDQLALAESLKGNAPGEYGVIGGDVGDKLKTLPSAIYWAALGRWGIRMYPGTEGQYQRALDDIHRRRRNSKANRLAFMEHGDDIEGLWEHGAYSFHPGLPEVPASFPDGATFELTKPEARYLQERVRQSCSGSLLADLLAKPEKVSVEAPWEHPQLASFQPEHRSMLWHGRVFSNVALGAAILYNQLLAELRGDEALLEQHRQSGHDWLHAIGMELGDVTEWASDMPAFWAAVENRGHAIDASTMIFVEQWTALLLQHADNVLELAAAKKLVRERETQKKRGNSRFTNSRVRDQWGGSSGLTRMTYRWRVAQIYVSDMAAAVGSDQ